MRVFRRGLILGGLLLALAAGPANATPILSSGDSGDPCDDVLGVVNSNCSLFSFDTSEGSKIFDDLVFASDADVALFKISTGDPVTFFAEPSQSGLFPFLGLFNEAKELYSYDDPINGPGSQAQGFFSLAGIPLAADSTYYLAVLLIDPSSPITQSFAGTPTSLTAGFACDGVDELNNPLCSGAGGTFSLQLSALPDGGPQPVPEPGTLALVGGGAVAALVRRRSRKRKQ